MNEEIIKFNNEFKDWTKEEILFRAFEKCIEKIKVTKERDKTQNNWNELKKWLLDGTKEDNWVQGDMFWKEACKSVINKMQELEKKDDR